MRHYESQKIKNHINNLTNCKNIEWYLFHKIG